METPGSVKSITDLPWQRINETNQFSLNRLKQQIFHIGSPTHSYLILIPPEEILSVTPSNWTKLKQSLPLGAGYIIAPNESTQIRRSPHKTTIYRPSYPYITLAKTECEKLQIDWQTKVQEDMVGCITMEIEERYTALSLETWQKLHPQLCQLKESLDWAIAYPYPRAFSKFWLSILSDRYSLARAKRIDILITYPLYELFVEEELNQFQITVQEMVRCPVELYTTPFLLDLNFFPTINEYTSIIVVERA